MHHEIGCAWTGGMAFEAEVSGTKVAMDADEAVGGKGGGCRPKPLLLASLAGCSGMDVVSILAKMRENLSWFNIRVEGEVSEEHPKRYTAMMMGGWFLAMSIGSKMAGVLSGLWESIEIVWIFVINCGSALLAAILMGILTPKIRTIMEKHEKGKQG